MTTSSGDLVAFSDAAIRTELEMVERLLSQSRRLFLMGAGCSKVAGLPLTTELCDLVMQSMKDAKATALLESIRKEYDGDGRATIEDYLSDIVDLKAMADRRVQRGCSKGTISYQGADYAATELDAALSEIKRGIRVAISSGTPIDMTHHRRFVRHVDGLLTDKPFSRRRTDYFVLNYDTLIEDALGRERIRYSDGLAGGITGWWDPSRFDDPNLSARVVKLHGSIDWCLFDHDYFPSRLRPTGIESSAEEQVMIWPTATKYRETQLDPYAQVLDLFRRALRPGTSEDAVLMIVGYSFGDTHINLEIERGLKDSGERLSVLAMCYDDIPPLALKGWLTSARIGQQVRAYCRNEMWHGGEVTKYTQDVPWGDFSILARLLGGER
ncbi:MAG: SIR2 family protein [Phycisphaerales bacterium]